MNGGIWGRKLRGAVSVRWLAATVTAILGCCVIASVADAASPSAGGLLAFGTNQYGQLGIAASSGTADQNSVPTLVTLPGASGTVTEAAAGASHSLVLTSSGQVYSFGLNDYGQLGTAANSGTNDPNPTPALVTLPGQTGTVTQITAGGDDSFVATSSGQLYAFGWNEFGQLGTTTNVGNTNSGANANPTPELVTLPGQNGAVVQVSAGDTSSLVLTASGQLYAFGSNDYGQLGNTVNAGNAQPNSTPTLVTLPGQVGSVSQISEGDSDSIVLTTGGQVYAFGNNNYGELGSATNAGTSNPNPTPTVVSLPGEVGAVTQVSAGETHTLVLTSSDQLYGFGDNAAGQLGNTTNDDTTVVPTTNPTPVLIAIPRLSGAVTQIAASYDDSRAVTSSGQYFTWGLNFNGSLGNGATVDSSNPNPTPALADLPAGTTIDTIARGSYADFGLAIVSDLTVTSSALPTAPVNQAYSATVTASGGAAPVTFTASGLPAGLAIDAANGTISGTPTAAGGYPVTVTAADSDGDLSSATLTLTVTAPPTTTTPPPPKLTRLAIAPRKVSVSGRRVKHRCVAARRSNRHDRACRRTAHLKVSFTVSAPTTLTLHLARVRTGRRVGTSCVAATTKNRKHRACTRVTAIRGQIVHVAKADKGTLTLSSTFAGHRLGAGRYRLTVTPAGGAARTATFTITG